MNQKQLPELYQNLLNHPNLPLAALRETEHKLFQYHLSLLWALPKTSEAKARTREEVQKIAKGVVLIQTQDREIWEVELDWADHERIGAYSRVFLWNLIHLVSYLDMCVLMLTLSSPLPSEQYPVSTLKSYIKLFPDAPMASFLRGYLTYFHLQDQPEEELGSDGKKKRREKKDEELLAAEAAKEQELAFQLLLVSD